MSHLQMLDGSSEIKSYFLSCQSIRIVIMMFNKYNLWRKNPQLAKFLSLYTNSEFEFCFHFINFEVTLLMSVYLKVKIIELFRHYLQYLDQFDNFLQLLTCPGRIYFLWKSFYIFLYSNRMFSCLIVFILNAFSYSINVSIFFTYVGTENRNFVSISSQNLFIFSSIFLLLPYSSF